MDIISSQRQKEEEASGLKRHAFTAQSRQDEAATLTMARDRSPTGEVMKLAAIALSLNVRLRSSDMPVDMQERALRYARSFLDDSSISSAPKHRPNPTLLARALKKEFDSVYGVAWHCVAGKSFGSFVTHSPGGFMYFSIDSLFIVLFKTEVKLVTESEISSQIS
ncbi:DYNEIN LIGHT CHAIN [Salix purpurea]|uniref:Dynein light chain n=1 Tax=Salix purpurea TaxID=77065 RepID=A0A9Q0VSJ1_SALPP|nr:DYNEIN LIGHT CHAIN [Salix purpurea]